jgi:peptide deformylase
MAIKTVLKMGEPLLLQTARPVTEFNSAELHLLLDDMHDTMTALEGAGLAAPQIGVSQQVVVFGVKQNQRYPDSEEVPYTVLINPEITFLDDVVEDDWEGCLSVPGLRGLVPRNRHIRYTGFDQFGKRIDREAKDFHARVVQHECDHLRGILYPMRIRDMTQFGFTSVLLPNVAVMEE